MLRLLSAKTFYRWPSDSKEPKQDGSFVNSLSKAAGVIDGNDAAFSPKNRAWCTTEI